MFFPDSQFKRGVPFSETLLQTEADVAAFKSRFGKEPFVSSLLVGKTLESGFADASWNARLNEASYPTTKLPYPALRTRKA